MQNNDPRARSLGLFASRLEGSYLAFGGLYGNVISAVDLREEEPDNPKLKKLLAGTKKGWIEWDKASEKLWDAWFEHLSARGITALRVFPRRRDNGDVLDLCGKVNESLLEHMQRFMAAAQPYGIKFMLILMPEPTETGYLFKKNLKQWVVPAYKKSEMKKLPAVQKRFVVDQKTVSLEEYFTDSDVWACQRQYLDALLEWVKKEPQIFALELVNEQGWARQQFHWDLEEAIIAWGSRVADYVRKKARKIPVCLSHPGFGILGYEPTRWMRESSVDFYSPHIYCGVAGAQRGMEFGTVTDLVTNYSAAVKPAFVGEWGVISPKVDGRVRQLALRDAIWFSVLNGCPGLFHWVGAARYENEYKKARDILDPLELHKLERHRPLVGIDISRTAATLAANDLYQNYKRDPWKLVGSKAKGDAYMDLLRCTELFLNHGVAFDFTLRPKDYEISTTPAGAHDIYVPPEKDLFAFPRGDYQCKFAAFGEWEIIIAYFRNIAPVVAEGYNLRAQEPRPFQTAWQLPKRPRGAKGGPWHYRLTVHNLDTGEMKQNRVARESSEDFGNEATADYIFVFQR